MTYEVTLKRIIVVNEANDKQDAVNRAVRVLGDDWDSWVTYDKIFDITVNEYDENDIIVDTDKDKNLNIVELDTVDEANGVDLSVYRWSERMSAKTGRYVFVRRQIKRSTGDIGK